MKVIQFMLVGLFIISCGATQLKYTAIKVEPSLAKDLLEKSLRAQPGKYKTYDTKITDEYFASARTQTGTSFWTGQIVAKPGVDYVYFRDIHRILFFDDDGLYIVKLQDNANVDLYKYVTKNRNNAHNFINALEGLRR